MVWQWMGLFLQSYWSYRVHC